MTGCPFLDPIFLSNLSVADYRAHRVRRSCSVPRSFTPNSCCVVQRRPSACVFSQLSPSAVRVQCRRAAVRHELRTRVGSGARTAHGSHRAKYASEAPSNELLALTTWRGSTKGFNFKHAHFSNKLLWTFLATQ